MNDRDFVVGFDRAQLVADSQVIDQIDQRLARGDLLAQSVELGMLAGVQPEDRARVDLQRGQQTQTVLLGGGKSFLVRQNASAIEFLEPHARDKSGAMQQPALDVEGLRVLKDRGTRRPLEDARRNPVRERFLGGAVAICLAREFEPHDVVRTAFVKLILTRGADQIVRRRHDVRRIADNLAVVHQCAERLDSFAEFAHFSCRRDLDLLKSLPLSPFSTRFG